MRFKIFNIQSQWINNTGDIITWPLKITMVTESHEELCSQLKSRHNRVGIYLPRNIYRPRIKSRELSLDSSSWMFARKQLRVMLSTEMSGSARSCAIAFTKALWRKGHRLLIIACEKNSITIHMLCRDS